MTSYIYFIQAMPNGPVKIGTTALNPHTRMKNIQTGCPWPVKMLGAIEGTSAMEKQFHDVLSYFRGQGEWFDPHPTVLAAIKTALTCGKQIRPTPPKKTAKYASGVSIVISELGGTGAVARLLKCRQTTVSNWKKRGTFPTRTFITLQPILFEHRITAPNSLWGMPESGVA